MCWLWHKWSRSVPIYNHEGEFSHHQRDCEKCRAREERWTDRVTGEPMRAVTEKRRA